MKERLRTLCDVRPASEFFVDDKGSATYADLAARIDANIAWLRATGVHRSAVVVVKGDFSFPAIAMLVALVINGNIIIPQTEISIQKVWDEIRLLGPQWLIEPGADSQTCTDISERGTGHFPWHEILPTGEPGLVVFTSGTTGRPKAIIHSFLRLIEKFASRPSRSYRTIPFLLFDHMGGVNTLLSVMFSGGTVVHEPDRTVDALCAAVQRHRVTLLPTTPTFLTMLLVSEAWKTYDLSSLELITYGTEVMSPAVLARLSKELPAVRFKQTYGLSEVGVLMTSSPDNSSTWVKLLGEGLETRVEDGILWLKVPSMMLGHAVFDSGRAQFVPQGTDWFCTQDMVETSESGHFRFLGRVSDIINVSGLKVYPSEVETTILGCPGVANVAVFGKKSALVGQIVAAQVERHAESPAPADLKKQILEHCRRHLDRYKIPQYIEFVDRIPLSGRLKKVVVQDAHN